MITTVRAALAVGLLVGYYVFAAAIVLLFGVPAGWLMANGQWHIGTELLGGMALGTAAAVGYTTWQVARASPAPASGLVLSEQRTPALWALVRELAAGVGTRPPDEIRLVADVNAAVAERSRWLGLVGGRRTLLVGLPLLQAMTVAQMRAVLAHELGHYSHHHTRLSEPIRRGRQVIATAVQHLTDADLPKRARLPLWLLRGYAWVYFRATGALSRTQEVEADRAAVRLAGREASIGMMREMRGVVAAWRFYLDQYVRDGVEAAGVAPASVLSYFPTFLAARAPELAELRAEAPSADRSPMDSHPSDAERIALMAQAPEWPVMADLRPATIVVRHLDDLAQQLDEQTFRWGDRPRVPFERYRAEAIQGKQQRHADELYRAAARLAGGPASLATVLDLLAAGRLRDLVAALLPPSAHHDPEAVGEVVDLLARATAVALVRAGAAGWRHPWAGHPNLVDRAGQPVDIWKLANRAVAGEADPVREELRAAGVDLADAGAHQVEADAREARALAGITNAVVNKERRDVIIASTGILVFPTLPWLRQNTVQQRMGKLLAEVPVRELATRPEHRFVPYEEVAAASVIRRVPATFEFVLRSGDRLRIRFGRKSDDVNDGWEALGRAVGFVGTPG